MRKPLSEDSTPTLSFLRLSRTHNVDIRLKLEDGGWCGAVRVSAMRAQVREIVSPSKLVRASISFAVLSLLFVALWEGYKTLGAATGGLIPLTSWTLPVAPNNTAMPHMWDIARSLFEPAQRGTDELLITILLEAARFTFREAAVGFLIGSSIGFSLGVLFVLSSSMERGLMPYVIASQTVPLLAIAPMIVVWGRQLDLPFWTSVSIIAAYLSFFPVTINTVRGLRSPQPTAVELMRSYAASPWEVLWKLRVPAALPFIFTALKVAATASVVGALIGELPASLNVGLGRSLLTASYFFGTSPERLFGAVVVAALLGLVTVGIVSLAERLTLPKARRAEG